MARHCFDPAPLDYWILRALEGRPSGMATYVIRNCLAGSRDAQYYRTGLETSHVLTAWKRLKRAGRVRRVPSVYAVMIAWTLVPAAEIPA